MADANILFLGFSDGAANAMCVEDPGGGKGRVFVQLQGSEGGMSHPTSYRCVWTGGGRLHTPALYDLGGIRVDRTNFLRSGFLFRELTALGGRTCAEASPSLVCPFLIVLLFEVRNPGEYTHIPRTYYMRTCYCLQAVPDYYASLHISHEIALDDIIPFGDQLEGSKSSACFHPDSLLFYRRFVEELVAFLMDSSSQTENGGAVIVRASLGQRWRLESVSVLLLLICNAKMDCLLRDRLDFPYTALGVVGTPTEPLPVLSKARWRREINKMLRGLTCNYGGVQPFLFGQAGLCLRPEDASLIRRSLLLRSERSRCNL